MYFQIIYSDKKLYHARLYNSGGTILFWTKEFTTKQPAIDVCAEVRRNMSTATPIYDVA
jgi:uncharacterized protein YegP (UPF0339 family)